MAWSPHTPAELLPDLLDELNRLYGREVERVIRDDLDYLRMPDPRQWEAILLRTDPDFLRDVADFRDALNAALEEDDEAVYEDAADVEQALLDWLWGEIADP